jgi:hypothetical protein
MERENIWERGKKIRIEGKTFTAPVSTTIQGERER